MAEGVRCGVGVGIVVGVGVGTSVVGVVDLVPETIREPIRKMAIIAAIPAQGERSFCIMIAAVDSVGTA